MTAVDVYRATFAAKFDPLPPEHCKMEPSTRAAFNARDGYTDAAVDPILFEAQIAATRITLELLLEIVS